MFARRCRSEKFEDCDLFWSFAELHNTKCISLDYRQHTGGKYCLPPTGLQKPLLLIWNYCLTYIKKIHIYKFVSNAKKRGRKNTEKLTYLIPEFQSLIFFTSHTKSFLNKQKRNISLILEEMTVFSLVMITVIQEQGNDAKADSETVHFMYLIKCMCPLFSCC